jgi:transcriptional regulator with XRE-family HTH domain
MTIMETTATLLPLSDDSSHDLATVIPARLRKWRKDHGITLTEVGKLLDTSPQNIQRLETGTMSMSLVWFDRLCKAYDLEPFDLFGTEKDVFDARLQQAHAERDLAKAQLKQMRAEVRRQAKQLHAQGASLLAKLNDFLEKTEGNNGEQS